MNNLADISKSLTEIKKSRNIQDFKNTHISESWVRCLEKGFDPKKPLWADKGDGCGVAIIKCFEESIRIFFDWA